MAKYKYGQFVKTPKGRMRVRKGTAIDCCDFCYFGRSCFCNLDSIYCMQTIPIDAYLEKPKIRGGKSTTSK